MVKNVYIYLNNPDNQHIFRFPELIIIDILRMYIEQLERKKERRVLEEVPDQEEIERKGKEGKKRIKKKKGHKCIQYYKIF